MALLASEGELEEGEILPRGLPFVGFRRHAPPQPLVPGEPDHMRRADGPSTSKGSSTAGAIVAKRSQLTVLKLLRESPYVGFCRHAPPSPTLSFARSPALSESPFGELLPAAGQGAAPGTSLPSPLPDALWVAVLSYVAEVPAVLNLARVSSNFEELLRCPGTWQGIKVRVQPSALPGLAPVLGRWLKAWQFATKLVVPRSAQLLAEIGRLAPQLKVEVAWRFDSRTKGDGLEVVRGGAAVRRVSQEDLVALGDAPLVHGRGRPPYVEVRLERLDNVPAGDGLNDFGIGVTACNPEDLDDVGAVAAEVPRSWVVDFAQSVVCLSVNNREETKGFGAAASTLCEGDRVGVRVAPLDRALEVFINGELRDRLAPAPGHRIPPGATLFPVMDLYGRAVQLACTDAEGPAP